MGNGLNRITLRTPTQFSSTEVHPTVSFDRPVSSPGSDYMLSAVPKKDEAMALVTPEYVVHVHKFA